MENSNNEQYVYLLVIRTLGVDKTTFDYDVIPFKTLDAVNNAVLDDITNMAKTSKGEINFITYTPRDNIDISETTHTPCGKIVFKSNVKVLYKVLLRKTK